MQARVSSPPSEDLKSKRFASKILLLFVPFMVLGFGFSVVSPYLSLHSGARSMALQAQASFWPCSDERSGIVRGMGLMHTMDDGDLFKRAAFVSRVNGCSSKVAFMFLSRGPLPLSKLWEKFFKGNEGFFSIYIHSLPDYKAEFPASSVFYKRQIPSQVTEWGQMSMCDAERRLLANALLDPSNEQFVLLSESCIPLYNFSTVHRYLTRSHHSFVGTFDDPGPHGRGRFNPSMSPEVNITQWRKGAQWFEVDRKLAVSMVSDTKYYKIFKAFCRPACYVDEHYFPTMLVVKSPDLIANRSVTWTDWSRGGPHPATFGKTDVSEAFFKRVLEGRPCQYNNRSSSVCFLFARKFAPSSLEPLLQLAPRLLGFG